MTLYETLNIPPDADAEMLKKAYRKKANETHPDKNGGDDKEFKEVARAYQVLKDPNSRSHYDKTGQEQIQPFDVRFATTISGLLAQIVEGANEDYDVVSGIRQSIANTMQQLDMNMRHTQARIGRIQRMRKRISKRSEGNNVMDDILRNTEVNLSQNMEIMASDMEFFNKVIEKLEDYEYR